MELLADFYAFEQDCKQVVRDSESYQSNYADTKNKFFDMDSYNEYTQSILQPTTGLYGLPINTNGFSYCEVGQQRAFRRIDEKENLWMGIDTYHMMTQQQNFGDLSHDDYDDFIKSWEVLDSWQNESTFANQLLASDYTTKSSTSEFISL